MPVRNAVYALQAASKPQYLSSFHFPKQKAINYIMHCYTAKIVLTMVYGQISTNTAKMNKVWDFFCVCIYFRTTIYVFVLSKNNYWCTAVHKQGLQPKTQSIVLQLNQLCFCYWVLFCGVFSSLEKQQGQPVSHLSYVKDLLLVLKVNGKREVSVQFET